MERNETLVATDARRGVAVGAYIDWPAILGGAVVAAALAGLFTTFGAALGLTTISAEPGEGSFGMWMVVTAIWMVVTIVISYLAGGYIAGRLRRRTDEANPDEVSARDGINGLVVWGIGMLVTAWMAASIIGGAASAVGTAATAAGSAAGGIAQAAGSVVGGAVQGAAQAVGAVVPDDVDEGVMDYINNTLMRPVITGARQTDGMTSPGTPSTDNAELAQQTGMILGNVLRTGEISDDDRAFMIAAVAQRTGQTEQQVTARVDQAVEAVQEARAEAARMVEEAQAEAERVAEEAKQAAIDAAETARTSAIMSAFLLTAAALVAAAAALSGAVRGGRHRDEGRLFAGFTYRPR